MRENAKTWMRLAADLHSGWNRMRAFFLRLLGVSTLRGGVPKGVISSATEWIRQGDLRKPWGEKGRDHWQVKVRDAEMIMGRLPRSADGSVHPAFYEYRFVQLPELRVTCIRRGRIATADGVILSPDDRVFDEFTHNWGVPVTRHPIFSTPGLPKPEYQASTWATLVVPASSKNIGHWLVDGLLRLAILEASGLAENAGLILPSMKSRYADMVEALGYGPGRYAGLEGGHWEVEHLLVPSFLNPSGFLRPWAVRWLRARLGIEDRPVGGRRLWVSRSRARWRKILNEEEVFGILEKQGFEMVVLDGLSFQEQVNLFSEAEIVAGPEGANMTNLLFAPRGIRVLEMHPPRYVNALFYSITNALDQNYFYAIGETSKDERGPGNAVDLDNYRVPLPLVEQSLRLIGLP